MDFKWADYRSYEKNVELWIDDDAKKYTGCEDGWEPYFSYWESDPETSVGENFWGKVVLENDIPVAVMAIGLNEDVFTVSEFIVDPKKRGRGFGSAILKDLISNSAEILGKRIKTAEACIYPNNIASQKAFEKSGFSFSYAHEDGDAWYYKITVE